MSFHIGRLRPYSAGEVKHIKHSEDTRTLQPGDIVETLDHVIQWDEDCLSVELCERWRGLSDTSCDQALRQTFNSPSASVGKDLLRSLEERQSTENAQSDAVGQFLDEVYRVPPTGILVSEEDLVLAQEFFLDNSVQIMQALLHYSLAGGFASPRIVRTLEAVSYLVPHPRHGDAKALSGSLADTLSSISQASSNRTFSRLLETLQFVLDVMGCSAPAYGRVAYLLPGGEGWRSIVRVRLLHGIARWRTEERWKREGVTQAGVAISQEDLAATLAAFSTVPIWCLHRLHLPPSPKQARAYLAVWRHVGFYLGVDPKILLRYFSSTKTADKFLATAALHLFCDDPAVSGAASEFEKTIVRGPTIPILVAVSNRPPLYTSLEYNIALTSHLLGPSLSAHLGLPPTPLAARVRMHAVLFAQRLPHYFARFYPRRAWLEKRRAVLREGMMRSVRWNLGLRRTTFRPRTMVQDSREHPEADAEGGDIAPGVAEEERVKPDPARAKVLTKMWSEVWAEMIGICVVLCAGVGAATFVTLRAAVYYAWT
ncbi:hypothetical protein BD414DRAFT_469759 [Trametes punicea]|nr:hypothetical protein BD414DRAFT_469759 [Trametes punicea]